MCILVPVGQRLEHGRAVLALVGGVLSALDRSFGGAPSTLPRLLALLVPALSALGAREEQSPDCCEVVVASFSLVLAFALAFTLVGRSRGHLTRCSGEEL